MNPTAALIDALLTRSPSKSAFGFSGESHILGRACQSAVVHYLSPVTRQPISLRFAGLAETWRDETSLASSATDMILNSAYQRIIGLGPDVVPVILSELRVRPDHWFWALTSITGVNPVPDEAAGNLQLMTNAWLAWGREQGLIA
jgi:hypothetical protein